MTNPTETGARDLAARIADALRGVTPGEWEYRAHQERSETGHVYTDYCVTKTGSALDNAICEANVEADARLIAAAPGLLREAAARIDADAARIAALEALVAELDAEGKWLALLRSPEGQRVLQELAAEAYREYEAGLTEDMDDDDE